VKLQDMIDSIRDYMTGIMTNRTFHRKAT